MNNEEEVLGLDDQLEADNKGKHRVKDNFQAHSLSPKEGSGIQWKYEERWDVWWPKQALRLDLLKSPVPNHGIC